VHLVEIRVMEQRYQAVMAVVQGRLKGDRGGRPPRRESSSGCTSGSPATRRAISPLSPTVRTAPTPVPIR